MQSLALLHDCVVMRILFGVRIHPTSSTARSDAETRTGMELAEKLSGLSQPLEDARLGEQDRVFGKVQGGGDLGRRLPIDGEAAKRFPCQGLEVGLNDRQQFLADVAIVLNVPVAGQTAVRIDQALSARPRLKPDRRSSLAFTTFVPHDVNGDLTQPGRNDPSRRRSNRGTSRISTMSTSCT